MGEIVSNQPRSLALSVALRPQLRRIVGSRHYLPSERASTRSSLEMGNLAKDGKAVSPTIGILLPERPELPTRNKVQNRH